VDGTFTNWRKSSRSSAGDNCVEVATSDSLVGVRDSKNPGNGALTFDHGTWTAFLAGVNSGCFELRGVSVTTVRIDECGL